MEKQLKCVLVLSLKDMTLRKVAILLFTDSDIVAAISKFQILGYHTTESVKEWHGFIEDKIKNKLSKFELPESLEKRVIDIVKPIGLQIRRWKDCQEFYLSTEKEKISLPDSSKLFWTSTGTVDYRKTAQELARCNALDIVQRYKLACVNCLEDDIPLLWEKLPEEKKLYFYDKILPGNPGLPRLPFCWPHIITGELSTLDYLLRRPDRHFSSFNQWAFECSAENGNKVAVEYFFQKLTSDERETSLPRTVEALLRNRFGTQSNYLSLYLIPFLFSDISCYLLASMTPAQQMEVFREHPGEVLLRFLDCPWPDLFLENVGLMWDILPPSDYSDFLLNMAKRFRLSEHYFPKLFQEFFVQSPLDCKKCFIDQNSMFETLASQFLLTFFQSEDSESVKIIFRNIDAEERMRLVLSEDFLRMFHVYMLEGGHVMGVCVQEATQSEADRNRLRHMMEVCVQEATQSKADRNRLKKAFLEYHVGGIAGHSWWYSESLNREFNRFFDSLDEGDKKNKAQKRRLENCCPQ